MIAQSCYKMAAIAAMSKFLRGRKNNNTLLALLP
ncbi:hypothetical protein CI610_03600 [invertebrate metagenome]|uniref:Uncharacterized protein n=1 Tax=invertebrate metagenome TaxID=1711999 RepID=A0A2H9T2Q6_9ZZZZ